MWRYFCFIFIPNHHQLMDNYPFPWFGISASRGKNFSASCGKNFYLIFILLIHSHFHSPLPAGSMVQAIPLEYRAGLVHSDHSVGPVVPGDVVRFRPVIGLLPLGRVDHDVVLGPHGYPSGVAHFSGQYRIAGNPVSLVAIGNEFAEGAPGFDISWRLLFFVLVLLQLAVLEQFVVESPLVPQLAAVV